MVQRLKLCAANAGDRGSIPRWRTKIPHAKQCSKKNTTTQDPTEMGPCPPGQLQQEDQPPCSSPGKEVTEIIRRSQDPNHSLSLAMPKGWWSRVAKDHHPQSQLNVLPIGVPPAPSPPIWYQIRQTHANGNLHTFWPIRKLFGYRQCTGSIPNTGAIADKRPANQS